MPADIAQHLDPVESCQPFGVVGHDRVMLACAESQEAREHLLDAVLIALDLLDRKDFPGFILAGGVADAGGAAAHQRDRLVAGLLQPVEAHDLHHGADVKRRRGAVETDIADKVATGRELVQRVRVRNLMNKAAAPQHIEKIRFKNSHFGATLIILIFSRYSQGVAEPWRNRLPQACALWHYKMCLFDTSWASRAGASRGSTMALMLTAIGLMSVTSLDGVDVALIETDGRRVKAFGPTGYRPYTQNERGLLRQALTEAVNLPQRDARPGILREAEHAVTIAHAEAVAAFTAQNRLSREDVDIVGFHGQTVLHRPAQKMTVQIGDAAALAKAIHIPVMHDFRAADVAAGGQGAPFVPVYHRALAQSLEREGPMVVVNIGGVSNITYIDGTDTLIACDTGPGNALLDDYMYRTTGQALDCEGRMAAQGVADEAWVARALEHPFFARPPPKSLDRHDFASLALREMRPADGAATLTAFTAAAIARIVALLPKVPLNWIVVGGGARNHTMMRMLRERLAPATIEAGDALGWSTDAIEAQAFGFLAARGLKGLPLSYPATTGVPIPMTGGVIARP